MNSGLRLEEQRVDDMLDMLHYLFESDNLDEEEVAKAKVKMRRTIYKVLYMRPYTWHDSTEGYHEFGTQDANGDFGGSGLTHKPYIPPTPVNANSAKPFGAALDAPLG